MRQLKRLRCLKGRLAGDGEPTARREGYGDAVPTAAAGAFSVSRPLDQQTGEQKAGLGAAINLAPPVRLSATLVPRQAR